jgi:excinuclease ABC subunit C
MREALTRRAMKFGENPPPSLWLLDGGKAVLNLADEILQSCGANVEILAIAKEKIESKAHRAKGKAFDTVYTKTKTLKLPASDKRLQFLQNLRDEAHRFAITFHRKQKTKKDKQIELMKLKGIKEGKIKKLLDYFGSFEEIQNASASELSNAIGTKDGEAVYQFYRGADE